VPRLNGCFATRSPRKRTFSEALGMRTERQIRRRSCEARWPCGRPFLRLFEPSEWRTKMDRLATIINGIHDACLVLIGVGAFVGAWALMTHLQGM
jgi:hypothetical protein